ncbi:MAG TPA: ATP-binding cassette domain-containing protein, partial [Candidatus Sulfotelmatobacter sp.]|nr:ATP-binding cassette domain-containing protein [Candidatus Sulfotelmatobacter sp.]
LAGRVVFGGPNRQSPGLGYVPQRETLDPIYLLSSFEVVLMGACRRVRPGCFINRQEREWVQHCLQETGAEELSRRRFSQLSGGQRQRVLIARALATRPDLLLLDEPTAGIDANASQAIMELLRRLHEEQRLTILMVNHDLTAVRKSVQQVIWLHQGKVLFGPVAELLSRQKIEEIMELELD